MKLNNNINSLVIFIVFVVVSITNTNFVLAAPAREFFVINEQAKQCGIYWPGDEFSQNKLPVGWKTYEPKKSLVLKTPYGTCNGEYINQEQYYQGCAQQIGYKYVDYKNIPYTTNDVAKFDDGGWKCSPRAGKDYYQGFLINEKNKELTTLIDFSLKKANQTAYPTEGQCTLTDKNWVPYEYQENSGMYEGKIVTPFGECNNFSDYDYKVCCNQLGLTDVERDLIASRTNENINSNLNKKIYIAIAVMLTIVFIAVISGLILFKKNKMNLPSSSAESSDPSKVEHKT
ncbi:MAG: hypothetical protein UW73_C0020G0021 [Microgenomates group bacterium GW2011_GWB1_44_8]|nr:MAG: hypothetical protein UW73_C0020G0021 [Microgenomates group bacterium GW2011_GWB1_44_8]